MAAPRIVDLGAAETLAPRGELPISPLPPPPMRSGPDPEVPEKATRRRFTAEYKLYVDQAPKAVYATLLDVGTYLSFWRTMYRILTSSGEVRERRNQLRHPPYQKPELLATGPNQVWSWDITKLLGGRTSTST